MSGVGSLCFRPEFNFTSQYLVRVDDFFLHYLQKVNYLTARNKWSVMIEPHAVIESYHVVHAFLRANLITSCRK